MSDDRLRALRSLGWYAKAGPGTYQVVVGLPTSLAERYRASGRVRVTAKPLTITILALTVTDRETGATVRIRGERTSLSALGDPALKYVTRLWTDARAIVGLAHRQVGGRPSEREDRIDVYRTQIEAMRDGGWMESRIYAKTVLQRLGRTGDDSQLRDDVAGLGGWSAFRRQVYRGE